MKLQVDYESSNYRVEMKRIPLDQIEEDSDIVEAAGYEDALIALYLFDETAVRLAIQEVDDQSVVIGFIYMDNSSTWTITKKRLTAWKMSAVRS